MERVIRVTWCTICGYDPNDEKKVRQHILAKHYDYLLGQCKGDKELLKNGQKIMGWIFKMTLQESCD